MDLEICDSSCSHRSRAYFREVQTGKVHKKQVQNFENTSQAGTELEHDPFAASEDEAKHECAGNFRGSFFHVISASSACFETGNKAENCAGAAVECGAGITAYSWELFGLEMDR